MNLDDDDGEKRIWSRSFIYYLARLRRAGDYAENYTSRTRSSRRNCRRSISLARNFSAALNPGVRKWYDPGASQSIDCKTGPGLDGRSCGHSARDNSWAVHDSVISLLLSFPFFPLPFAGRNVVIFYDFLLFLAKETNPLAAERDAVVAQEVMRGARWWSSSSTSVEMWVRGSRPCVRLESEKSRSRSRGNLLFPAPPESALKEKKKKILACRTTIIFISLSIEPRPSFRRIVLYIYNNANWYVHYIYRKFNQFFSERKKRERFADVPRSRYALNS